MARSCSKIAPLTTVILAITPPQMGATIQMRNFIYFPKSNWTMLSWYWCIYFFNLDYLKNEQPTPITICPFWLKSINMYFYLPCDHYFCSVSLVGHLSYEPMQACCRWHPLCHLLNRVHSIILMNKQVTAVIVCKEFIDAILLAVMMITLCDEGRHWVL